MQISLYKNCPQIWHNASKSKSVPQFAYED